MTSNVCLRASSMTLTSARSDEVTSGVIDRWRFRPRPFATSIGIAKPSGHGAHGSQQGVLSEGGIIVQSDGLAQCGLKRSLGSLLRESSREIVVSLLFRHPTNANSSAWQHLPKVLINRPISNRPVLHFISELRDRP
jgi:hypothetical protein